eukprot:6337120-Amphidinium_carterae.2
MVSERKETNMIALPLIDPPEALQQTLHRAQPNVPQACARMLQKSCVAVVPSMQEVDISYGNLSNPRLWRTYGFTVPAAAVGTSCTFSEEELQVESRSRLHS